MAFQIKKHHQRYTAYQDTGIPWLGEMPEEWKNGRVKNIKAYMYYPIGDGDHGSIKPDMYEESGIPYIRVQNLSWGTELKDKGLVYIPLGVHRKNMKSCLRPKDILIAKTGATVGKTATIPESIAEANTTSSVGKVTVDHKNYDYRYFCYVFRSKQLQEQIWELSIQKSAQPGFNIDDLIGFVIPIPPTKSEQHIIANYLDEKTELIDQVVIAKKRQIELLKEKRSSLINRAVTRGIEGGVEMKDSGVEWLGEVPKGWEVRKLKQIFKIQAGGDLKVEFYSDVKNEEFQHPIYTNSTKPEAVYGYTKVPFFKGNSITVTGRGEVGYAVYRECSYDAIIRLLVLTPWQKETDPRYFTYQINAVLNFSLGKTAVAQLSTVQISPYKVAFPGVLEQKKIADYLDTETAKIDQTIALVEKSISLLEEYKTSLISNVVTGKIKVN